LRQLFQGHLDLRALREERRSEVTGSDGEARSHVRSTERSLTTLFGPVRVARLRYGGRGVRSLFPADLALNLPQEEYSHGLRRRAAELAATVSFDETVRAIDAHTGGHVPARQAQELVRRAANDFDAFYAAGIASGPEDTQDLLVLSLDGKGIAMRPEHLREATRKAAEKRARAAREGADDGSDTRRPHRDRMATV
ncbi:MAG: ISKra4 family transposase, partial [bacterium]|nr:ISKra4 family transposase [bacterium]